MMRMLRFLTGAILLFACGCSSNPLGSSPEAEILHGHLTESLNDPKYEVIKFWPAIDSAVAYRIVKADGDASLATANAVPGELSDRIRSEVKSLNQVLLDGSRDGATLRMCRLKSRNKTEGGGLKLNDNIYVIDVPSKTVFLILDGEFERAASEFPK